MGRCGAAECPADAVVTLQAFDVAADMAFEYRAPWHQRKLVRLLDDAKPLVVDQHRPRIASVDRVLPVMLGKRQHGRGADTRSTFWVGCRKAALDRCLAKADIVTRNRTEHWVLAGSFNGPAELGNALGCSELRGNDRLKVPSRGVIAPLVWNDHSPWLTHPVFNCRRQAIGQLSNG